MKKSNIPIIVSSVLLMFVIIVIVTSKKSEESVANAFAITIDSAVYEEGISWEEGIILTMFDQVNLDYSVDKLSNKESVDLHRYLKDYFIKTSIHLENSKFNELKILIEDLKSVSELENKRNIRNMTMQSRTLALHSIESIYKICGLNIEYTIDGIILKISDFNNIYYTNKDMNNSNSIHYHSLIIVVGIIILLYINCFMIVKKNKLYLKGEKYDELNEKGFA
jgi:hypothetical protein